MLRFTFRGQSETSRDEPVKHEKEKAHLVAHNDLKSNGPFSLGENRLQNEVLYSVSLFEHAFRIS